MRKSTVKKETPQGQTAFKVVLPLAIGGESALYPTKFARLGADFVGEPCKNDSELIALAALDVTDPEPPGLQNPLLDLDNVIITAHSAFFSPKAEVERWHRPVEEIARVMISQWPESLVNPEAKKNYVEKWGKMEEPK